MEYAEIEFFKRDLNIKGLKTPYYLSPILKKHGFIHAFFTKNSSYIEIKYLSNHFQKNYKNCFNKQIHSDKIIFGSQTDKDNLVKADGLVSDKLNQSLWIYTADCMPILVADLKKRIVASLHCGRKGLERKIIMKLIKLLKRLGSHETNLIVAIGPTISSKKYTLNKDLFHLFNKSINSNYPHFYYLQQQNIVSVNNKNNIELDLKLYAFHQLLKENIHYENIDISNKCTYLSNDEFYSFRKTNTEKRQWSFISN